MNPFVSTNSFRKPRLVLSNRGNTPFIPLPFPTQPLFIITGGNTKSTLHRPLSPGGTGGALSSPPPTTTEEVLRLAFPEAARHLEEMGMGMGVKGGSTPVSPAPRNSFSLTPRGSFLSSTMKDASQTEKGNVNGAGEALGPGLSSGFKRISVLSSAAAMASTVLPLASLQGNTLPSFMHSLTYFLHLFSKEILYHSLPPNTLSHTLPSHLQPHHQQQHHHHRQQQPQSLCQIGRQPYLANLLLSMEQHQDQG